MHDMTRRLWGANGKQYLPGKIQNWSRSFTYLHCPDDSGQNAISLRAYLALKLYPQGVGSQLITALWWYRTTRLMSVRTP